MGQHMKGRINARLEWLGDMEPEYEEILDLICLSDESGNRSNQEFFPLSWVVMENALRSQAVHRYGV